MVLTWGYLSVIGRMKKMQDTITVVPEIIAEKFALFGVYDGHGGVNVANVCRDRLHKWVEGELLGMIYSEDVDWTNIMKKCFSKMDDESIMDNEGIITPIKDMTMTTHTGSTATVVIVGPEEIVVANCGDSRAILYGDGVVVPLSTDHTPNNPDEVERVEAAGGQILEWNGSRVQGMLNVSRSIGDHYLRPYVISEPAVKVNKRNKSDEIIIIATDGLWDFVSDEVACNIVRKCFNRRDGKETPSVEFVAKYLAKTAVSKGSEDDVSVLVVKIEIEP